MSWSSECKVEWLPAKLRSAHYCPVHAKVRALCLPRAVWLFLLVAGLARGQESQFLFDPNGNLLTQTPSVSTPPQILSQPQDRIVPPGESASFFVVAADTRALTYQWRFNGTNITSATNDALVLQNVGTNDEGEYRVVLANPSGSVTSSPAFLMLDSDFDGMADSSELAYFPNLDQNPDGDFDGDGTSNSQELLDGTDPADTNSVLYHLTVMLDGGSVVKVPDQATYTNGQIVTLTAVASSNETFHAWLGDVVTRSNSVTLPMTSNVTVYARFTPIIFTWTTLTNGDWETATNWSPALVPGPNDSVVINNYTNIGISGTVTLNTSVDCISAVLGSPDSNPTLTGSGTLTVHEKLSWLSGTMSGSGRTVLEPGSSLTLGGATLTLNTRTLELGGETLGTAATILSLNNGVVTNRAGAVFQTLNSLALTGNGRFDNAGTFRKSASTVTLAVSGGVDFNNYDTLEIQTGTLECNGGFNNDGAVNVLPGATCRLAGGGAGSGPFTVPATALLEWTGGTFTLDPGAQLGGEGTYRVGSTAVAAVNTDLMTQDFDLAGGTLNGSGTLTIGNAMNWTGGRMEGGGRTIIGNGAVMNADLPSAGFLSARTLENGGTILFGTGLLGVTSGAVITNRSGALFRIETETATGLGGGVANGRFDNAGTFRKSAGTGATTIASGLTFNNSGIVDIQTGTLLYSGSFNNGGEVNLSADTTNRISKGGSGAGAFVAPATALVDWTGGTFTLNPGAQLNGAGLYRINGIGATVVGDADLTVQNLDMVHGSSTLSGTGTVTVASVMNWTAGTMDGSGRTIIRVGATLQVGSPSAVSLKRTLENGGTAVWTGSGTMILLNGIITNRVGALFEAQNAARFFPAGGNCRFDNDGTYRKTVSTGTNTVDSGMTFNNYGAVDIRSGILLANGNFVSTSNAVLNCALGGTTAGTNYGQLQVAGSVNLNGSLSVDLVNGFSPGLSDSFSVLIAGARNGAFANFLYPTNVVTMQLSNSPNSVIVRVTDVLAGIPQPTLLPPQFSGSDIKLIWTAVSNASYRVEFNPDLTPSNWTALPGDVIGVSSTAVKFDALTPSNRFYRVHVLP